MKYNNVLQTNQEGECHKISMIQNAQHFIQLKKKKKKKPSYKYGKKNVYNNYKHARSLINLEQKKKKQLYMLNGLSYYL